MQEERSEQLKAVTDLAAVIAGFEMIAFLQFQFDSLAINKGLQFAYVATSGLTVSVLFSFFNDANICYAVALAKSVLLLLH